jgi:hypothetical protein
MQLEALQVVKCARKCPRHLTPKQLKIGAKGNNKVSDTVKQSMYIIQPLDID